MPVLEPGAAAASSLCSGEAEGKTVGEIRKDATEKAKAAGEAKETPLCCKDMDECCAPGYSKRICNVNPGYATSSFPFLLLIFSCLLQRMRWNVGEATRRWSLCLAEPWRLG